MSAGSTAPPTPGPQTPNLQTARINSCFQDPGLRLLLTAAPGHYRRQRGVVLALRGRGSQGAADTGTPGHSWGGFLCSGSSGFARLPGCAVGPGLGLRMGQVHTFLWPRERPSFRGADVLWAHLGGKAPNGSQVSWGPTCPVPPPDGPAGPRSSLRNPTCDSSWGRQARREALGAKVSSTGPEVLGAPRKEG